MHFVGFADEPFIQDEARVVRIFADELVSLDILFAVISGCSAKLGMHVYGNWHDRQHACLTIVYASRFLPDSAVSVSGMLSR